MTAFRNDPTPRAASEDELPVGERTLSVPRLRRGSPDEDPSDRESVTALIRDIPNFVKLLGRLVTDPRVSKVDKGIVAATVAYMVWPMDLIPDFIPFLGQVDDLYLLALALDRLLNNAGTEVLLDHWDGDMASLETAIAALDKAGSFLPERVRTLLGQRLG